MANKAHDCTELLAHLPTIQDKWENVGIDDETHWATIGKDWHWENLSDPIPMQTYVLEEEDLRDQLMDGLAGDIQGQVDVYPDRYVYTLRFGAGESQIYRIHHWMLDESHALHTVIYIGEPHGLGRHGHIRRYRCEGVTA